MTGSNNIGGLIGELGNTLTSAYATGAVTVAPGGSGVGVGGLIGVNDSFGNVTSGYFDACTAFNNCALGSLLRGPQSDGSIGKTTAALQSFEFADTHDFQNNTLWGIVPGISYPYLCWQFGGCGGATPQVVSGTVYQDQGATLAGAGITVAGLINGAPFNSVLTGGAVATGANGYYYYLVAPNTIPVGGNVLTYAQNYPVSGGTANGATLADQVTTGNATGLDIYANTLHEITSQAFNSTVQADLATALGSNSTATNLVNGLVNLQIDASAASFDVDDTTISFPFGSVTLNSNGGIIEPFSGVAITANALAVNAVDSVDLPQTNMVGTLAANVTGLGSSFDLVNGQTLTVDTVNNLLSGITTNNGNVVLQTVVTGDIVLNQPINTVAGASVLTGAFAQIGLSSAGGISEGFGGGLVAPAVTVSAANAIDLPGVNLILSFAGQVTGAGQALGPFSSADLSIDSIQVSAGSVPLPIVTGVTTNGGGLALGAGGALTLNQQVNSNGGVSSLGASPGLVQLISFGGDVRQAAAGTIVAGQLYANSLSGNVILTAANHIGANDDGSGIAANAGLVAGFAAGNFEFVNHNAGITIDTLSCGCLGIFTYGGNIDLATTGAGAITVNAPLNSGNGISIAVAPGYGFTNNASDNPAFDAEYVVYITSTAGLDTTASFGPIVILADQMSLSGGTINAGLGGVLLGPASTSGVNVALGTASGVGTLGLQQADLATITAGVLQIGYRNPNGTVSFTGNIDVAGNIQLDTDNLPELLLVTGGAVTESGGAITASGPNTLALGVVAGSATMNQNNGVGTLAAFTDGANARLQLCQRQPEPDRRHAELSPGRCSHRP